MRSGTGNKAQAQGLKPQAVSKRSSADHGWVGPQARKPSRASSRILDPGSRYISESFEELASRVASRIQVLVGCFTWNAIWCGEKAIFLLVVTFNSTVKNPCFSV